MKRPVRIAIPLAVLGSAAAAAAALGASIPIYTNAMSSTAARGQLVHLGKSTCARGGGAGALNVTVGKQTRECQFRTPVVGANLDITATTRLLAGTPSTIQARTFVAVSLRDGGNGQYQLAVFPKKGSFQLRRDVPPNVDRTLLAKGKASGIKAVGKPNKLRLQVFPTATGETHLTAFVNGKKLASVVDDAHTASTLTGRFSTVSVGSAKAAKGAAASFDDLTVAVPDPFG
ncbi:MAG: hypothetical protein M3R23_03025 [Actinomycetota bacterium]|nr:hypothetical protein [Actinomycetota bacterium]